MASMFMSRLIVVLATALIANAACGLEVRVGAGKSLEQAVTEVREARRAEYVRKLAKWDPAEVAELARLMHQLNSLSDAEA